MFAPPAPACRGAYMGRKRWAQPYDRFCHSTRNPLPNIASELGREPTKKPQISPLRCAPVEMTILLQLRFRISRGNTGNLLPNRIVISTGAQRSGEICGFFFGFTRTPNNCRALRTETLSAPRLRRLTALAGDNFQFAFTRRGLCCRLGGFRQIFRSQALTQGRH
jgi:hypothetical protein